MLMLMSYILKTVALNEFCLCKIFFSVRYVIKYVAIEFYGKEIELSNSI